MILILSFIIIALLAFNAALLINQRRSNAAMKQMLMDKETQFQQMITSVFGKYGSVPTIERQRPMTGLKIVKGRKVKTLNGSVAPKEPGN